MEDLGSLKFKLMGKEKEIAGTEKILKMYAEGYVWNSYTVRKDLWQTPGMPMVRVIGSEEVL